VRGSHWSAEADDRLRALWAEGLSSAAIGRAMGLTKNAVVGRAHRLKLPARPSPIVGGVPRERAPRPLAPRAKTLPAVREVKPVAAPKPAAVPVPVVRRVVALGPVRACQWIKGEPAGADSAFCGAPTVPGCSWCEAHYRMVFRPQVAA
jgi:GcrA cell cycle regulator